MDRQGNQLFFSEQEKALAPKLIKPELPIGMAKYIWNHLESSASRKQQTAEASSRFGEVSSTDAIRMFVLKHEIETKVPELVHLTGDLAIDLQLESD